LPPALYLLSTLNPVWVLEPLATAHGLEAGKAFGRFLMFSAVYLSAVSGLAGLMLWRFDRIMGRT
jgi:hypothetical protein